MSTPWTPAEAAALIDRFALVPRLRRQALLQAVIGVVVALAAVGYNLVTPPARAAVPGWVAVAIAAIFGPVCLVTVRLTLLRSRRLLQETAANARERVVRLAEVIALPPSLWLRWATAGHLLVGLATLARIRFSDGLPSVVLWAGLVPTVGLVVAVIRGFPTRKAFVTLV